MSSVSPLLVQTINSVFCCLWHVLNKCWNELTRALFLPLCLPCFGCAVSDSIWWKSSFQLFWCSDSLISVSNLYSTVELTFFDFVATTICRQTVRRNPTQMAPIKRIVSRSKGAACGKGFHESNDDNDAEIKSNDKRSNDYNSNLVCGCFRREHSTTGGHREILFIRSHFSRLNMASTGAKLLFPGGWWAWKGGARAISAWRWTHHQR